MRIAPVITLSPEQRTVLESQVRSRSLPLRVVERSRIVLFAAAGRQDKDIAVLLSMTPKKVSRWRKRFLALGVPGVLQDAPPAVEPRTPPDNDPLLQTQRPGYSVRRAECGQRRGLWPLSRAAPASGMAQVFAFARSNYGGASRTPPDR